MTTIEVSCQATSDGERLTLDLSYRSLIDLPLWVAVGVPFEDSEALAACISRAEPGICTLLLDDPPVPPDRLVYNPRVAAYAYLAPGSAYRHRLMLSTPLVETSPYQPPSPEDLLESQELMLTTLRIQVGYKLDRHVARRAELPTDAGLFLLWGSKAGEVAVTLDAPRGLRMLKRTSGFDRF